tara:strand:+ start:134 stop:403 length:270 start_codon:yes stop_codon:yes gene_type:complete
MKRAKWLNQTNTNLTTPQHEILLMNQLRHPNIILLMGAVWSADLVGIVLEFASGGSLSAALKSTKVSRSWNWEVSLVSLSLRHVHTKNN